MQKATLKNWAVVNTYGHQRLSGFVMGHPKLDDGYVLTSVIVELDEANGTATTNNTVYTLVEKAPNGTRMTAAIEEDF